MNLKFYDWLLSERAVPIHLEALAKASIPSDQKSAYKAIIESSPKVLKDISSIQRYANGHPATGGARFTYVEDHYLSIKSLDTYLAALSDIHPFHISVYEFFIRGIALSVRKIDSFVSDMPLIIELFVKEQIENISSGSKDGLYGVSCIGQEQLIFTLALGAEIKKVTKKNVVVGGSIFSRIFERGLLPEHWFGRYFDFIARHEGEIPLERLVDHVVYGRGRLGDVPSLIYKEDSRLQSNLPTKSLQPKDIPVPDFDDMPLGQYYSSIKTLPILSSRGCYWGKCEFCHSFMIYGERYGIYEIDKVVDTIKHLSEKYSVKHFAFNDEAIPPKIFRGLGNRMKPNSETGLNFTGLIKFEKYYNKEDFENASKVGFRSLYVGLESASERVLSLMKKNNTKDTMLRNLQNASDAGIWMHCFLFFGFPGETNEEAKETYDFVLENSDKIASFGCGAFTLEHNAPISHHTNKFGVLLEAQDSDNIDVYYRYDVQSGLSYDEAKQWSDRLNRASTNIPRYVAMNWIPREHLLAFLSKMSMKELIHAGSEIVGQKGLLSNIALAENVLEVNSGQNSNCSIFVNRLNRRSLSVRGASREALRFAIDHRYNCGELRMIAPEVMNFLENDKVGYVRMYSTGKVV